jgi:predicted transport protein
MDKFEKLDDTKKQARDVSNIGHWGCVDYEVAANNTDNLEYIFYLIKQAL